MLTFILLGAAALVVAGLLVMVMLNRTGKGPGFASEANQPVDPANPRGSARATPGND